MALVNKILVPTDFSEPSRRALEYAAELAIRYPAPLVLAHVYTNPVVTVPDGVVMMTPTDVANLLAQLERGLIQERDRALALGVREIDTALVEGTAWHEIVNLAKQRRCDLIVMGTHGRGGLSHFLLGSVAEKVVRHADGAVMTVRASEPKPA